jgi:hypothetical protein
MAMFCGKCGTKRDSRSKYCISCGQEFKAPLKEEEAKKLPKEKLGVSLSKKPVWVRVLIVAGGVAGVVCAVLLVFWLAGTFRNHSDDEETVAEGDSPLSLVDQARAKADAGDLDGAIKQMVSVTDKNSTEGVFFWYLADFYREKGQLELGIRALEKCYECYKEDSFWGPESLKKKEEFRLELLRAKSSKKGEK